MTGCVPLLVGESAYLVGSTIADRRSTGVVVNDKVLETRITYEIDKALREGFGGQIKRHITVTSYNGRVLLTGEIESEKAKQFIFQTAATSTDVKDVVNEVCVDHDVSSMWSRISDTQLKASVSTRIFANEKIQINQMKVVAERGIIYLMGILTAEENKIACEVAAKTSGVKRVISLVEILSQEQINRRMKLLSSDKKSVELD